MGQLEELMTHRQSVESNIEKSFGTGFDLNDEFEKARSGVYADNAENRRLKRVGQKYGSSAAPDQGGAAPQGKKAEEGGQKSEGKADSGKLANYASDASDEALKRAAADKNAAPEVKAAAQAELKKRGGGKDEDKKGESSYETATPEEKKQFDKIIEESYKEENQGKGSLFEEFVWELDPDNGNLEEKFGVDSTDDKAVDKLLREKVSPKRMNQIYNEWLKREGGSSKKTDSGKKDAKGSEEKTDEGGFSSKTANAVESAFKELTSVYDDAMNDDGSMAQDAALDADEKFYDKISDLVMKEGLTEKDFRKIKDSNPSWKYGFDTDWDEIKNKVKEKKENEREKRYVIKSIIEDGSDKRIDAFVDDRAEYFQDILKPYGVKDLYSLSEKLETEYEDDEKDPYGYDKYAKIFVKCLRKIPAKEFKDFNEKANKSWSR